jgi:hypothetical protein
LVSTVWDISSGIGHFSISSHWLEDFANFTPDPTSLVISKMTKWQLTLISQHKLASTAINKLFAL